MADPGANMRRITDGTIGGDGGQGPVRVGIFATPTTNTRAAAGASYWGVLNLSDNVGEYYYRYVAGQSSRSPGSGIPWGDGNLTAGGDANTPNWVITCNTTDIIVRGVTNSSATQPYAAISGRGGVPALWDSWYGDCVGRYHYIGGRGGR